jgi:preprotein translocase subunit Sss1
MIWHRLHQLANVIGILAALTAIGILGYYVSLAAQVLRSG